MNEPQSAAAIIFITANKLSIHSDDNSDTQTD